MINDRRAGWFIVNSRFVQLERALAGINCDRYRTDRSNSLLQSCLAAWKRHGSTAFGADSRRLKAANVILHTSKVLAYTSIVSQTIKIMSPSMNVQWTRKSPRDYEKLYCLPIGQKWPLTTSQLRTSTVKQCDCGRVSEGREPLTEILTLKSTA